MSSSVMQEQPEQAVSVPDDILRTTKELGKVEPPCDIERVRECREWWASQDEDFESIVNWCDEWIQRLEEQCPTNPEVYSEFEQELNSVL